MIKCKNCGTTSDEPFRTSKNVVSTWCDRCRETRREAVYRHKKKKYGTLTNAVRAHKYSMTVEQSQALKSGTIVCGICNDPIEGIRLHVDHCHELGLVRGFLCPNCNTGIGKLGEDPQRIRAAADYVEKGGTYGIGRKQTAPDTQD